MDGYRSFLEMGQRIGSFTDAAHADSYAGDAVAIRRASSVGFMRRNDFTGNSFDGLGRYDCADGAPQTIREGAY